MGTKQRKAAASQINAVRVAIDSFGMSVSRFINRRRGHPTELARMETLEFRGLTSGPIKGSREISNPGTPLALRRGRIR